MVDLEKQPLDVGALLDAGRERLERACRRFGVRVLALFGSHARGDPHQSSDLDLAVDFDGEPTPDEELGFLGAVTEAVGTDRIDVVNVRRADPLLLRSIALCAVPIYESVPGSLARVEMVALARFMDTARFRLLRRSLLKAAYSNDG